MVSPDKFVLQAITVPPDRPTPSRVRRVNTIRCLRSINPLIVLIAKLDLVVELLELQIPAKRALLATTVLLDQLLNTKTFVRPEAIVRPV